MTMVKTFVSIVVLGLVLLFIKNVRALFKD